MSESGDHLRGMALAAGGMLLISPDGLLFRLMSASDLQILGWRGLISGCVLALYIQATRPGGLVQAVRNSGFAGAASTVLMTIGTILFVMSITRTAVAHTLVILSTVPMFGAILGWIFLRERVGPRTWLAIGACMTGIVLVFWGSFGGGGLLGDVFALGAAIFMACNLVIIRAKRSVSLLSALALSGLLIGALLLPVADPFALSLHDFGIIAVMGFLFQSLAFGMFLAAARHLPPAEVGLFALIETVLGPLWAWVGVNEVPSGTALLGGLLVVATLAAHAVRRLRQMHAESRVTGTKAAGPSGVDPQ